MKFKKNIDTRKTKLATLNMIDIMFLPLVPVAIVGLIINKWVGLIFTMGVLALLKIRYDYNRKWFK